MSLFPLVTHAVLPSHISTGRAKKAAVIVSFTAHPSRQELSRLRSCGFDLTRHLTLIDAAAGYLPSENLSKVAHLAGVKNVTLDQQVVKTDAFTMNSSMAGAAYQSYGCLGTGICIAVLDSGITNVADFGQLPGGSGGVRLKSTVDFTNLGQSDQCGHGTHVAGIIAGDGQQSTGNQFIQTFTGVARGANLVSVRVLDNKGSGSVSNVIAGVQWAVTNRSKFNIRVINMSLGHPVTQSYTTDPLNQAVEAAWKAGIVVVCAAGNGGRLNALAQAGLDNGGYGTAYGTIECPGNDPYVITVGATKSVDGSRADDQIATYSARGPSLGDLVLKPDIVAPGNRVISVESSGSLYLVKTYPSSVQIQNKVYQSGTNTSYSDKYMMLSGTSMATPVVSGAIVLMLQNQPNLTPDTVKARLMVSADKWLQPNGSADACTFGAGYLNVKAAMASTVVATSPALSPSLIQPSSGTWFVDLDPDIYGQRFLWGTGITSLQAIYGNRAMWGTFFCQLNSNRAMWGTGFYVYNSSSVGATSKVDCTGNCVLAAGE